MIGNKTLFITAEVVSATCYNFGIRTQWGDF